MNKSQRLLLPLLVIIIIASSCSSKFSVSKRRYMKGYHVSIAKNTKTNKTKVENAKNEALALSLKETRITNQFAPVALADQKETVIDTKSSFCAAARSKKKGSLFVYNNHYLSIATNVTNTKNITNSLIEKQQTLIAHSAASTKQTVKAPFDLMGWSGIGSVLVYVFASIIGTVLLYGFLFLMLAAFSGAIIPVWLIGFLIAIGILIIVGIIVVVVINGD